MDDIIACLIVYNEEAFIKRCIESLNQVVDGFIIVDGAFQDFPHDEPWSTDKTLDIIRDTVDEPTSLIEVTRPWANQVHKRNEYLKHLEVGDWMFQVDADEEIIFLSGAYETIRRGEYDGYCLEWVKMEKMRVLRIKFGNPRIVRMVKGMHYAFNHYSLFDAQEKCMYNLPYRKLDLSQIIKCMHYSIKRSPERQKDIDEYYRVRKEYASGIEGSRFECCSCHYVYYLQKGDLLQCPRCSYRRAAAHSNIAQFLSMDKPYMSDTEIELVNNLLKERKPETVLEFGSGGSTLYFPSNHSFIKKWVSVEHNIYFYEKVSSILQTLPFPVKANIELRLKEDRDYYSEPLRLKEKYDMVFIDGQYREICLACAKQLLNPGGFVLLHDSGREWLYGRAYRCYSKKTTLIEDIVPIGGGTSLHRGLMVFED